MGAIKPEFSHAVRKDFISKEEFIKKWKPQFFKINIDYFDGFYEDWGTYDDNVVWMAFYMFQKMDESMTEWTNKRLREAREKGDKYNEWVNNKSI